MTAGMLTQSLPTADVQIVTAHLAHITRRWSELGQECLLELVFLSAADKAEVKQVSHYKPDDLDLAASDALAFNKHKLNCYVTVNPVSATNRPSAHKRASAEHIVASFYHWADADSAQAAENIRGFVGPKPTFFVITGTEPCTRPHVYWELDKPTSDFDPWAERQRAIAATLGTDSTVVDPPRIMRLAGTVNWPKPKKQAKGYVPELTTLTIHDADKRPPVTSDQMARAFPGRPQATETFDIDTGGDRRSADDYAAILTRARTDGEKHGGVRDLTASLAGAGVPQAMCEAIVRQQCPVWDEGVETLIRTAYEKFYKQPERLEAPEPERAEWPTRLTDFNEMRLPRRRWVYGYDYIRKYVSVTASAGGVGKTSQAIVEGLAIATGKPLLKTAVKEKCAVWIINLEDPLEELEMRALAACKHYKIKPEDIGGRLFLDGEDTIQIELASEGRDGLLKNEALLDLMRDRIRENGIGVVVIDPFISVHTVNENSNASIQAVVAMLRTLARETDAAISLVHHTRKGNGESADIDSVRGAGSLIGAARAARVVNALSVQDAERLGVDEKERRSIFRVDDGKANLAPPCESAVYRKMIGVQLDNDEWVGVATPYEIPDEWSGMTEDVTNQILAQIAKGPKREDGAEAYYSARPQDKTRWVGTVITTWPFARAEDFKSEAQAKMIVKTWLKTGLLEELEYYCTTQRKDRKGVTAVGRVGEVK